MDPSGRDEEKRKCWEIARDSDITTTEDEEESST
jgi:hypothetical protein